MSKSITRTLITEFEERFEATRSQKDGEEEVAKLYEELWEWPHVDAYVLLKKNEVGHYGIYHELLDTMLVPPVYEELLAVRHRCSVKDGRFFIARRNGKYGIVKGDIVGTELTPFVYDKILLLDNMLDVCVFEKYSYKGLIEISRYHKAIEVLPAIYDNIKVYHPHMPYIQLYKDGKVGLYGSILPIPVIYDDIYVPYHLGWIKVKLNGEWGYINNLGDFTTEISQAFLYSYNDYML